MRQSSRRTPQRFRTFVDNSGLLIAGTGIALLWANLAPGTYGGATHALHFLVNDIAMAFFFGLAAKEVIEATAPGGPLQSPREAAVPLIAAVGGMAGPAALYLALVAATGQPELARGWAIPCATDIAFSYLIARLLFGDRHPGIPFLLLLAIADDAFGLVILAAFYPTGALRVTEFVVLLGLALAVAWWLRRRGTRSFWPYLLTAGVLSWLAFYRGGLHPALALVPVLPFLPHARRDPGLFVDNPDAHDTLSEFEHWWKMPVHVILFFFGLVNAGVAFGSVGAGTWIVLAAIVVGKPVGIAGSSALAVAAGLKLPAGVSWRDLSVLGVIAAIGFTVALFFATAAFPPGDALDQAKMGALFSFGSAALAVALAWALRTGRFSALRTPAP